MESRSTMSITQGLGEEYDHYKELWSLSEKLAFIVPREGERCFYFPQGHLQQMDLSTKYEFDYSVAHLNLPSQIFCRVVNVSVEHDKGEFYFNFTLIPDTETDPTVPDLNPPAEVQRQEIPSLFKRLMASHTNTSGVSAVNTSQSMHLGVLATSSHAVMTGTMFAVHYKQMASPFVIRLNKYLEAVNNNIHVGMRFKMGFQSDDSLEISFFGTIAGIEDFSPEWPNSKWRCLKVQWDKPATFPLPERVSPWEIQPVAPFDVGNVSHPKLVKSKRFNHADMPSSRIVSNSPTSPPAPLLWNESSAFLSECGKGKASLKDSSSFLTEPDMDKASTSALASFCNWFCCCFK